MKRMCAHICLCDDAYTFKAFILYLFSRRATIPSHCWSLWSNHELRMNFKLFYRLLRIIICLSIDVACCFVHSWGHSIVSAYSYHIQCQIVIQKTTTIATTVRWSGHTQFNQYHQCKQKRRCKDTFVSCHIVLISFYLVFIVYSFYFSSILMLVSNCFFLLLCSRTGVIHATIIHWLSHSLHN